MGLGLALGRFPSRLDGPLLGSWVRYGIPELNSACATGTITFEPEKAAIYVQESSQNLLATLGRNRQKGKFWT